MKTSKRGFISLIFFTSVRETWHLEATPHDKFALTLNNSLSNFSIRFPTAQSILSVEVTILYGAT